MGKFFIDSGKKLIYANPSYMFLFWLISDIFYLPGERNEARFFFLGGLRVLLGFQAEDMIVTLLLPTSTERLVGWSVNLSAKRFSFNKNLYR